MNDDPQPIEVYDLKRIPEWNVEAIVEAERKGWEPALEDCGDVVLRRRRYES
jgi:hypothetical protein